MSKKDPKKEELIQKILNAKDQAKEHLIKIFKAKYPGEKVPK